MPFVTATTIAAVGLGLAAVGTGVQAYGTHLAADASAKAEKLREQQMNLEAMRKRREIMRTAQAASAQSLVNATAQGAGEGSGLQGGQAQIAGRANQGLVAVSQAQDIGHGLFSANADIATGQAITGFGSSVTDFGKGIMANSEKINNVGQSYGLWGTPA